VSCSRNNMPFVAIKMGPRQGARSDGSRFLSVTQLESSRFSTPNSAETFAPNNSEIDTEKN
jgi:hypothetical protein